MKRLLMILGTAALAALAACDRGEMYESHGTVVDTVHDSATGLRLPDLDVRMTTDTVTVPVFKMEKDTLIVDKPVVAGKKQVEVRRPTVDVNRKP